MFKGSIVALITPFKNDVLDEENYSKLIHHHIENGTNGIVPAGTTGESPTLNHLEHKKVIEICVRESAGKVPIIAGTGSNSTAEAVEMSQHAEKAGVNGLLIVTPYYNKPTQEGLFQHYKKINDSVNLPIIIYNIPSRSVIDMSVETMTRLFELKNIVGVKDATGDLNRVDLQLKAMGNEFMQFTGEDDNAFEFNKRGGVGCISVTANVAAKLCSELQSASLKKDHAKAEQINNLLKPLHKALFIESNPSPVKYAASLLSLSPADVRLPLVNVTENTKVAIKDALKFAKLI
ncbi:4-hydroxy-tetrahydrodipicolinate synthase [Pelagibacteraceae bacterium]|nr:4-hydroxy-tetrahydrodipicolinate synthase [Pelagibacteraceae bacterium]